MIKINGQDIKAPDGFNIEILSLDKNLANARGDIISDIVGVKRRITIKYEFIDAESLAFIFSLFCGDVSLDFPDPVTGKNESGIFFCVKRQSAKTAVVDGKLWWEGAAAVLQER